MSPQARFNVVRATTRSIFPMKICIYSPPFVDLDAEILLQEVDAGWSYRQAFSWRGREMFVPRHGGGRMQSFDSRAQLIRI
mmetsp:Transcript_18142/g.43629  ORF Transcript_18142/g.43629 Transcript_18142/m.43629 type:complete len:81 (-) Transcript_18142:84-326(-)